jgi:hypothetical protein
MDHAVGRPSDVIYPARTAADGTRRRSSVLSNVTTGSLGTSQEGKHMTLFNIFGRKGGRSKDGQMEDPKGDREKLWKRIV